MGKRKTDSMSKKQPIHDVILKKVEVISENLRLLKLATPEGWSYGSSGAAGGKEARPYISFLPGQWVDLFTPASPKPGGFTITSAPSQAKPLSTRASFKNGYIELAIQNSPTNPPAAFFFQPVEKILGAALSVRVGGGFHWPHDPPSTNIRSTRRYVFIAGGVGINPLISMLTHLNQIPRLSDKYAVHFLYSAKAPYLDRSGGQVDLEGSGGELDASRVLFLDRLVSILEGRKGGISTGQLSLFLTGTTGYFQSDGVVEVECADAERFTVPYTGRRIGKGDLLRALGDDVELKRATVVYVCGVPGMTDEIVEFVKGVEGIEAGNVLCEKWW